jgi:histidinol-phosphate/aromatic aminotransferase/cobyric acid decarboxylase-like protein/GNAT superfamily N-acetyltransferase
MVGAQAAQSIHLGSAKMTNTRIRPRKAGIPEISVASDSHREIIYRLRHAVYARELGQHIVNASERIRDELDDFNVYIVATVAGEVAGFVSVTPAGKRYSIDKYLDREALPFEFDDGLFEIRLLTVLREHRGSQIAPALMYAAFRWIQSHSGTHVVALGRDEVLDLYLGVGMRATGEQVRSGNVIYHLLHENMPALERAIAASQPVLDRIEDTIKWNLPLVFREPPACYHGGAFFEAVGEEFGSLDRSAHIVNADVLDAWFPPAPAVLAALRAHLSWLVRTSPPTNCEGLVRAIARTRGVDQAGVLAGGGSSDLIFLGLTRWLTRDSRVLILDPMYGEYAHVLERVIGCTIDRLPLSRSANYRVDLSQLVAMVGAARYDMVIVVNPNSPTGQHVPRTALEATIDSISRHTRVWIDETYIDYVGASQSLERFAAGRENVTVCKSMSKVYALSGMRVGYLCGGEASIAQLRRFNPPWAVGLPSQVAGVRALSEGDYYEARWAETHLLRRQLEGELQSLGMSVVPGVANFLLCHLPDDGISAAELVARARRQDVFVRDVGTMGTALGAHAVRIAVKDAASNEKIVQVMASVIGGKTQGTAMPRLWYPLARAN